MEALNQSATPPSAQANISAIVRLEEEAQKQRSTADRVADGIANFVGSIPFVVIHLLWFGIWVLVNTTSMFRAWKFDPYPFQLLAMIVSLEAVLLSTFVLIKQNRMSYLSDRRDHLHLQINLLAEREVTRLLQMMDRVARHLGVEPEPSDIQAEELQEETKIDKLMRALDDKLSEEPG